jgi:ABC-type transport system involved in multi-copper enzyme maturation permease subunit
MSAEPQGTNPESPASMQKGAKRINWRNPFKRMLDNPVILKELRGRMRGKQAFILLTFYLGLISILISVVYMTATSGSSVTWNPSLRQEVGKAIFGAVVLLELLMVSVFGPSLTVGAITSEREHQTFDLLRTTLLSARSLVVGKLGSAFTYLFLLILTALPIQSLAFLLGGVGIGEMVASSLMLLVTALFFCTLGIFFSSFMKRTLTATVSSYGAILGSFLAIVLIFLLIAYIQNGFSYNNHPNPTREYLLTILLWFLISTNSFLAAIMSETILVDNQSLYLTHQSIFGNTSYALLSPWIIYIVFYLLLTLLLIFLSVRRVQRPDR